jgi:hypothetical protein
MNKESLVERSSVRSNEKAKSRDQPVSVQHPVGTMSFLSVYANDFDLVRAQDGGLAGNPLNYLLKSLVFNRISWVA